MLVFNTGVLSCPELPSSSMKVAVHSQQPTTKNSPYRHFQFSVSKYVLSQHFSATKRLLSSSSGTTKPISSDEIIFTLDFLGCVIVQSYLKSEESWKLCHYHGFYKTGSIFRHTDLVSDWSRFWLTNPSPQGDKIFMILPSINYFPL